MLNRILIWGVALWLPLTTFAASELAEVEGLWRNGDPKAALHMMAQRFGPDPSAPQARFLKGVLLTELDRVDEAIKVYEGLIRDFPDLPEPYNNLAVLHARQQNLDAAVEALQRAIKTHPAYAVAHENLGDVYAQLASIAYRRALANAGSEISPETQAQAKLEVIKELVVLPEMPALPTPADLETALRARVEGWARAWSEQRTGDYLNHYGAEFRPPAGLSRAAWEAERRERILAPRFIEVSVQGLIIEPLGEERVQTRFQQAYRADHYSDRVHKTLIWRRSEGGWHIVAEYSDG